MSGSRAMQRVEEALDRLGCRRKGETSQCPAHEDRSPSLSIREVDDRVLLHCHTGCTIDEVVTALDLKLSDLFNEDRGNPNQHRQIVATYDYTDEVGDLISQVVRFEPKDFRQRRPDGRGGWVPNLKNARRVPYHLSELIAALNAGDPVYIPEGEKDVEAIRKLGLAATCSPMGTGNWRDEYAKVFSSFPHADVRIVADKDDPGYCHAADIEDSLRKVGLSPRCFEASEGKDVSDHLASGLRIEELVEFSITDKLPVQSRDERTPISDLDPSRFFSDKTLIVPSLARVVQEAGHVKVGIDGRLYFYDNGVYRSGGEVFARNLMRKLLGEWFKKRHAKEVLYWLRSEDAEIGDSPPTDLLNVQNGLLDWRDVALGDGALAEHSPEFLSTIQIPVAWKPDATCPQTDGFFKQVLPEDSIEFIEEVIGYALYAGNPLRIAVLLLGSGKNGKTVLLLLIKALVGKQNVSAVSLHKLGDSRFAAAELYGKLANICGDLDARSIKRTDTFKLVTGGDPIDAERKYRDPFVFTPFALLLFSANNTPLSFDQSDGWFDRWIPVPMNQRIKDEDPRLIEKLTTEAELEGLLVKAVSGLQRLMERRRFELPPSVQAARQEYRERLDTVEAFVAEECVLNPEAWIARPELYGKYQKWATEGGRPPVSAIVFNDRLREGFGDRIREGSRGGGKRVWVGIGLVAHGYES